MANSSFLSFQNSENSTSSNFFDYSSFWARTTWFFLLFSIAYFISCLLISFCSNNWVALFSASATCLFRISSSWSLTFMSSAIYLSTNYCLISYFCLNLSDSLVFFKCSMASFFLAYSSIFLSSSCSLTAISYWIFKSSSLALLNSSLVLAALFILSRSLSFSLSSSSSTYFLMSWPSSCSSFIFLM